MLLTSPKKDAATATAGGGKSTAVVKGKGKEKFSGPRKLREPQCNRCIEMGMQCIDIGKTACELCAVKRRKCTANRVESEPGTEGEGEGEKEQETEREKERKKEREVLGQRFLQQASSAFKRDEDKEEALREFFLSELHKHFLEQPLSRKSAVLENARFFLLMQGSLLSKQLQVVEAEMEELYYEARFARDTRVAIGIDDKNVALEVDSRVDRSSQDVTSATDPSEDGGPWKDSSQTPTLTSEDEPNTGEPRPPKRGNRMRESNEVDAGYSGLTRKEREEIAAQEAAADSQDSDYVEEGESDTEDN